MQWRLMWGNAIKKSLGYKLVPVHYREYEYGVMAKANLSPILYYFVNVELSCTARLRITFLKVGIKAGRKYN